MQQRMGLADIADVARRANHRMHQARFSVHADVRPHAEIPLIAFLGLMHVGVTRLVTVLGRGRGGNQRGIEVKN